MSGPSEGGDRTSDSTGRALRHRVAAAAREYLTGTRGWDALVRVTELVPERVHDDDLEELIDLLLHEPKRGEFFGASEEEYESHMSQIREVIGRLET